MDNKEKEKEYDNDGTKCPFCGRIKAVEKKDKREYYCNYCQIMFDPTEE